MTGTILPVPRTAQGVSLTPWSRASGVHGANGKATEEVVAVLRTTTSTPPVVSWSSRSRPGSERRALNVCLGRHDRGDGLGVEREQLAQGGGVVDGVRVGRQLFDPDGRRVQQLVG